MLSGRNNMMMDNGMMGWGFMGGMGIMWLGLLLLLTIVAYVAYRYGQSQKGSHTVGTITKTHQDDEALAIAKKRYAQGEIDRDEFERLRQDLT